MIVYVDLIFLINFVLDVLVLFASLVIRQYQVQHFHVTLAALLGAFYAAVIFFVKIPFLFSFSIKILISYLMVWICFPYQNLRNMIRNMLAFYVVNFVTVGGVIAFSSFVQHSETIWEMMGYDLGKITIKWQTHFMVFLLIFLVCLWMFKKVNETSKRQQVTENLFCEVTITINEESWCIQGLVDTGNQLYEPFSNIPVIIVEANLWAHHFPENWSIRLQHEPADQLFMEMNQNKETHPWANRFRLLPYRTVNGTQRLIFALKPDCIVVKLNQDKEHIYPSKRVLIGLDGGTLSSSGTYQAIVHPDLVMQEGQQYDYLPQF